MARAAASAIAAIAAAAPLAAAAAAFPRTNGCAAFRCDASASSSSALALPLTGGVAFTSLINRSSYDADIVSGGCVSQGSYLLCSYPLDNDDTTYAGAVRVNADGAVSGTYSGLGSGHCRQDSTGPPSASLPAMDIFGDVIFADYDGVALVQGNTQAWAQGLDPMAACPDLIPAISVSATGRLMLFLASIGEIFGYYTDSVPVGSLVLWANDTQQAGMLPSSWAPHQGVLVPIGQQAIVAQRSLILTRYYHTADYNPRPVITPTADLRLSATDLQDNDVPRIARPWTVQVPLTPDLAACVPPAGGATAGIERLVVAGPVALANNVVVLTLTCPGLSNASHAYGFLVLNTTAGDKRPIPSLLWRADLPLGGSGSGEGGVVAGAASASASASIVRWMAVDAAQPPEASTTLWMGAGMAVVAVDGASGKTMATVSLAGAIKAGAGADSTCAAWTAALEGQDGSAAAVVTVEGPMLTSAPAGASSTAAGSSNSGAQQQLHMRVPVAAHSSLRTAAGKASFSSSAAAANTTTVMALPVSLSFPNSTTLHGVVSLLLDATAPGGGTGRAQWCAATPGTVPGQHPVEGQMTIITASSGGAAVEEGQAAAADRAEAAARGGFELLAHAPHSGTAPAAANGTGTLLALVTREGVFGLGAA